MRPEVRIIDPQSEEIKPMEIPTSETEALLAKYGYSKSPQVSHNPIKNPHEEETFEEMVKREEEKKLRQANPSPKSFNSDGYTSDVKWGSDSETGLNFKIEVVTNMKLPKY